MFTGLVEEVGTLRAWHGDALEVLAPGLASGLALGDSVAVGGICLTVTQRNSDRFRADVSASTRAVTTAKSWTPGTRLNLERALAMGDRLGGHMVSGHVDGVGRLVERSPLGEAVRLAFELPPELSAYLVAKGSIAVDGTSLTLNEVHAERFSVTVIPHTGARTTLLDLALGHAVNLEVDILAKYVRSMLATYLAPGVQAGGGLSMETLARCGFID